MRRTRIIAGGDIPDNPGFFVPLTIVRDITDGAAVVDEEPFGPILPVIKYSDLDDVIARANASPYGLGVEWGSESLLEFTAMQVINETRAILNQCTK